MIRTQIQLTEDQHRALRRWAAGLRISMSEAVRRCVASQLGHEEQRGGRAAQVREAMAVVGRYQDPEGPSRVAMDHDDHLADAYRA
ncbi:MAG: hypothetical protein Q8N53_18135 [Longimicrobiales bacterium]|nr:hypothetical protein [Longimicrobiales bacterium]